MGGEAARVKALVTGGGGFLGRAIVRQLLARGDEVRVLGRSEYPDLAAQGVACVRGDIADGEAVAGACAGVDAVFHTAALAGAWGPRAAYERTNVEGTACVLAGCARAGVGRLVFTSSPSVVAAPDVRTHHEGVDESTPYPTHYLADYPRTKAASERAVLAANGPTLATCALRPHLIVGPGDPHLLPRVLARARAGKLKVIGDGDNRVDLTYVESAARAHLLAADRLAAPDQAPAGRAYFISQGEPVELWPWLNALLEALGIPPVRGRVSARAAYHAGAALEGVWRLTGRSGEPPMTRFVATQLGTSHWFDITAAKRDLGYTPEPSMAEVTALLQTHYGEARAGSGRPR